MNPSLVVLIILTVVVVGIVASSLRIVPEGRRLAIVRLGRFLHLAGPGLVVVKDSIRHSGESRNPRIHQ